MGRHKHIAALILIGSVAWQPLAAQESLETPGSHTHKLAGFAAGVTVGAVVTSLDGVLGSSCIGSGAYLRLCRVGFVGGALVAGGAGALVGMWVRTDSPPGRTTGILVGSALGAVGAFLASAASCQQEDASNPEFLCGHDGMVETAPILGGAALGGAIGALISRRTESLEIVEVGLVRGQGKRLGMGASFAWRPDLSFLTR